MEAPQRRPNRLPGYDYSSAGCYFITVCTKDRAYLFGTIEKVCVGADVLIGPHIVLSQYGKIVEAVLSKMPTVEKYVIMPNHVHFILRLPAAEGGPMGTSAPTKPAVPLIVRYLKRETTRACGESLWQRSYYDHIIRNDPDYLRIWDYLDTNPMTWTEDCYDPPL